MESLVKSEYNEIEIKEELPSEYALQEYTDVKIESEGYITIDLLETCHMKNESTDPSEDCISEGVNTVHKEQTSVSYTGISEPKNELNDEKELISIKNENESDSVIYDLVPTIHIKQEIADQSENYALPTVSEALSSFQAAIECPEIPETFSERNQECHLLTHTGEKQFSCDICAKAFSRKGVQYFPSAHTFVGYHRCVEMSSDSEKEVNVVSVMSSDSEKEVDVISVMSSDSEKEVDVISVMSSDSEKEVNGVSVMSSDSEKEVDVISVMSSDSEKEVDVSVMDEEKITTLPMNPSAQDKQQLQQTAIHHRKSRRKKPLSEDYDRYPMKRYQGQFEPNRTKHERNCTERLGLSRIELGNSFTRLRDMVPSVSRNERASEVQILKKAAIYCHKLTAEQESLLLQKEKLVAIQRLLIAQVRLQRLLTAQVIQQGFKMPSNMDSKNKNYSRDNIMNLKACSKMILKKRKGKWSVTREWSPD